MRSAPLARSASLSAIVLTWCALAACTAPSGDSAEVEPDVGVQATTHEALGRLPPPPIRTCARQTSYADVPTLAPPSFFDDCAAATMGSAIDSFLVTANADAQALLADLNDCVTRVHEVDACAKSRPLPPKRPGCQAIDPLLPPPPHDTPGLLHATCYSAEESASQGGVIIKDELAACVQLLARAQAHLDLECPFNAGFFDAQANVLAAVGAHEAKRVSEAPSRCHPTPACVILR